VGDEIAKWVLAGGSTVLVGGPAGVGKSTALAHVAHRLQGERVACLVSVDRWENMRRITPEKLLLRVAGKLVHQAVAHLKLAVSHDLRAMLCQAGVLPDKLLEQPVQGHYDGAAADVARMAINEVSRLSRQGRVALVLDGLEKLPEGPVALDIFDAVGVLSDIANIVTVVPWHVAFGPQAADPLVRAGEHFVTVRAPTVDDPGGEPGRDFMRHILARRLGLSLWQFDTLPPGIRPRRDGIACPGDMPARVEFLARQSGGIPRTFLQLAADAGTYAKLRRNAPWPDATDLADAVADHVESLRRLLLPGDRELLARFDGSDGMEMDPGFKVRALAHGLLLERQETAGIVLRLPPLLSSIVGGARDA
jgi:DNA polymerase III delta prime subunit